MFKTGTAEGDRNILESENEPDVMFDLQSLKNDSMDSDDEKDYIDKKAKKIGDIINHVKKNHEKQERMFFDFEKNLGLKIKTLVKDVGDEDDKHLNDPNVDL